MILDNFYTLLGGCFKNAWTQNVIQKVNDGNSYNVTPNSSLGSFNNNPATARILLGEAENPTVHHSDYNVNGENTSLTQLSCNATMNSASGVSLILSSTYKNNTDESITITNIGICYVISNKKILITKEILDTTVTIQPGESYTFTAMIGA